MEIKTNSDNIFKLYGKNRERKMYRKLLCLLILLIPLSSEAHQLKNSPYIVIQNLYQKGEDLFKCTEQNGLSPVNKDNLVGMQLKENKSDKTNTGTYVSQVIEFDFPINEIIPSWNITYATGTGFEIYMRVKPADMEWSSWFYLGSHGTCQDPQKTRLTRQRQYGEVDTDYLLLSTPADSMQYKCIIKSDNGFAPTLTRFSYAVANSLGDKKLWEKYHDSKIDKIPSEIPRIPAKFRSQITERLDPGMICSPTSLSVVLDYYGIHKTTAETALMCFDKEYKIYGTWPRNTQIAYEHGCESWVHRFQTFGEVAEYLKKGIPVIASIKFFKRTPERGLDIRWTGHLMTICGISPEGNLYCLDSAYSDPNKGIATYLKEDIQKVWLDEGGVAYIVMPPK